MQTDFALKLALALKALTISNGRLAADLSVDKSIVNRWVSGRVRPSTHNLALLTSHLATRIAGFSLLDWELDEAAFADLVRQQRATALKASATGPFDAMLGAWPPRSVLDEAIGVTTARGWAYEGFWRSTRLSNEAPGRFAHDQVLMRRSANGLLELRFAVVEMRFEGIGLPNQTQLVGMSVDAESGVFVFAVYNGVLRHRADVLDGICLTYTRNAGGTPVASACVLERIGDLDGDPAIDDARLEALAAQHPLAPEGSIPENIRAHLFRDIGPAAFAAGGEAMLAMPFARSISTGRDRRIVDGKS